MRRLARGEILHVVARSDRYDSSTYTDVPIVDVSATYDAEAGRAALFLVNRSLDEAADLTADLSRIGAFAVINAITLHARGQQDRHATNLNDHAAVIPHASAPTRWQRASCRPICRHCRGPCWSLMSPEAPLVDNDARGS